MPEQEDEKKKKPTVLLKQYMVVGSPAGALKARKAALILATCPKLANQEFLRRFPDCRIWWTTLNAESERTKDDLSAGDPWSDGRNWMLIDKESDDEPDPRGRL